MAIADRERGCRCVQEKEYTVIVFGYTLKLPYSTIWIYINGPEIRYLAQGFLEAPKTASE